MRELAAGETRAQRLYFEDPWTWSREQAEALRLRRFDTVDWPNVIEEIEDVGNRHSDAWTSYCRNVISHLLKMEHSAKREPLDHWRKEVEAWRGEMFSKLRRHSGMKGRLGEMLAEAWNDGRRDAVTDLVEHGSPGDWATEKRMRRNWRVRLPAECPYALEDIAGYDPYDKDAGLRDDVWPAPVARAMNEELGADYPVRYRAPDRGGGRSR